MTQTEKPPSSATKAPEPKDNEKQQDLKFKKGLPLVSKYITILAWILMTLGLCIIVTTFYLAIAQKTNKDIVVTIEEITEEEDSTTKASSINGKDINGRMRSWDGTIFQKVISSFRGCHMESCKVVCSKAENIYSSLYAILAVSPCSSTNILAMENQSFPHGLIKNNWLPVNQTIYEVVISHCNVYKIKGEAFNNELFRETFFLILRKLGKVKIDSGALLGLYSLKYLTIDTKLEKLDKAFFQPVQSTLTHLRLHASLKFSDKSLIFGLAYMQHLEFADLSFNIFEGSLKKHMFQMVPNMRYLLLSHCMISSIEPDAFKHLKQLNVLNLSHNLLTSISAPVFLPLLQNEIKAFITLEPNNWHCDCDIRDLATTYVKHRNQFVDTLYCKVPTSVYGTSIDQIDLIELGCNISDSLEIDSMESSEEILTPTPTETPSTPTQTESTSEDTEDDVFQMRCLNVYGSSLEDETSEGAEAMRSNIIDISRDEQNIASFDPNDIETFQFEPPVYDFELNLLDNGEAEVIISDFNEEEKPVNVIWFSEAMESFTVRQDETNIDYNCMAYSNPKLLVDSLEENTTYTFCLIADSDYTITPFNCLPLHVPSRHLENANIWISEDSKHFTVGMLCLIFSVSTFLGAAMAYFGLKAYPDLLEGSKNVLVVKKQEQTCYVSTIMENDYMKQSAEDKKIAQVTFRKEMPMPSSSETPTMPAPPPPASSSKHLERLASMKSSSTFFDDSLTTSGLNDESYVVPLTWDQKPMGNQAPINNTYVSTTNPPSPPPLPKRNSTNSETLVVNRFSRVSGNQNN